jgi:hypothetical protein
MPRCAAGVAKQWDFGGKHPIGPACTSEPRPDVVAHKRHEVSRVEDDQVLRSSPKTIS